MVSIHPLVVEYGDRRPDIDPGAWVAPGCAVIGAVLGAVLGAVRL